MSSLEPIMILSKDIDLKRATDLLAYGSVTIPNDEIMRKIVSERLLGLGAEFAVAARRCFEVELHDVKKPSVPISERRFLYELPDGTEQETNLMKALNGIIHARRLDVNFEHNPNGPFAKAGNVIPLHYIFVTDRVEKDTYVDIFGMAWAFLSYGWDFK